MTRLPKLTPAELEAELMAAALNEDTAYIEGGDPTIDVLVVNGRDVAYAPKRVGA